MWVGWFWDDSTAQQSSRTPGSSILLFHHLQSVGFYSWVWCLSVTEWLPLFRTSWPHTIMPMGRKQGEGQHGNLGLSSWVSFFSQTSKNFPKSLHQSLLYLIGHNWVIWTSSSCKGGWEMSASVFQALQWEGSKKEGIDYDISNQQCLPQWQSGWMNEWTNQPTNEHYMVKVQLCPPQP